MADNSEIALTSSTHTVAGSHIDEEASRDNGTRMPRGIYWAAENGEVEVLERNYGWKQQKTATGNNVLHIHVSPGVAYNGKKVMVVRFVRYVLGREAMLLWQQNDKGDTPLHLAARFGNTEAVKEFLKLEVKGNVDGGIISLLTKVNKSNDTALHDATRGGHASIVELLVDAAADNTLQHLPNNLKETPLFLAAETGCSVSFGAILRQTGPTALEYRGPKGQTPLHAAVLFGHQDIMAQIMKSSSSSSLLSVKNDKWQTPIHCCASQNTKKNHTMLKALLSEADDYNPPTDIQDSEGRTALHIATLHCNRRAIVLLVYFHPDCIEIVDHKGRNAVHLAATLPLLDTFYFFVEQLPVCDMLINEKDNDGNTPLHLLAASTPGVNGSNGRYLLPAIVSVQKTKVQMAFNKDNLTAGDIIASNKDFHHLGVPSTSKLFPHGKRINNGYDGVSTVNNEEDDRNSAKDVEEKVRNMKASAQIRLVVAALMVTVSFTAGFTMPGGFDQSKGVAGLDHIRGFVLFLITNTIAFMLSSLSVIFYFVLANRSSLDGVRRFGIIADVLNILSQGFLMVAFVAGVSIVVSLNNRLAVVLSSIPYYYAYLLLLLGAVKVVSTFLSKRMDILKTRFIGLYRRDRHWGSNQK